MLQSLYVKNLALIDEIEVDFAPGLNVLSGETGAGKSIIIGSINLALGARYKGEILREGAQYGLTELRFQIESASLKEALAKQDVFLDDGELIISRKLMNGRSVCKINGETVNMNDLRQVSSLLLDLHGQHEHQSLLDPQYHLQILDSYAGEEAWELKREIKERLGEYRQTTAELAKSQKDDSAREKELELLRFEVKELQEAALKPGEDEALDEEYRFLAHSKNIKEEVSITYGLTAAGDASASEQISRGIRALQEAVKYDEKSENLVSQLTEIDNLLNDFNHELSAYLETLDYSEEDFGKLESRLNTINYLKTKYGGSASEMLEYLAEKQEEIQALENYEEHIENLKAKAATQLASLKTIGEKLSRLRKRVAKELEDDIRAGIAELNFADNQFVIDFSEKRPSEDGMDEVVFLVSVNPGQKVKPLNEVASGGELSRIMLVIKTVMAKKDAIPTLIFDEIDVGISGNTAYKVAEKMKVIADSHQVITITHLPQIAAMADQNYLIEKVIKGQHSQTEIKNLSEEETVTELARLLGAQTITETVMANAREMRQLAHEEKRR
ncbi:DNA repair protein RecN [Lachnospiraceae bacterium PF1-21]